MPRVAKKVKGLYERIEGSGIWYARFVFNGNKYVKSFGADQQAARAWLKEEPVRLSLAGGSPNKKTGKVTVGDLCDDLLRYVQAHPEEYRDQKNPPARIAQVKSQFGERLADDLEPHEISDWLDSLTKRTSGRRNGKAGKLTEVKISGATSNRLKSTISAMYKRGLLYRKVKTNPARDVKQRRANNGVIRFLSPAEETRLRAVLQSEIDACGAHNEQQRKRLIHRVCELDIALGTGMRQGEQYGLKWTDVDLVREVIVIRETKNGTPREVHLIDDVIKALKTLQELQLTLPASVPDALFCIGDPKKWWAAALKAAKIEQFRWHDLRHTFCSRLAQSGASLKVIQEAAGHKTIAMSARYAHMDKSSLRSAMSVLNRH